jgi:hypothetical protein
MVKGITGASMNQKSKGRICMRRMQDLESILLLAKEEIGSQVSPSKSALKIVKIRR